MKTLRLPSALLLICTIACGACLSAKDAPPPRPDKPQRPQEMRRNMPRRNPLMAMARLVPKELKAYQSNPTPENYAALEKALDTAVKANTAKQKARLEKQIAELDSKQAKLAADFLKQVKSGEFKMPERPKRGKNFKHPGKIFDGKRPDRPAED